MTAFAIIAFIGGFYLLFREYDYLDGSCLGAIAGIFLLTLAIMLGASSIPIK